MKDKKLTKQELKIRNMLLLAMTPKDIAKELGVTLSTVRAHCANMYKKRGVSTKYQFIAQELGLTDA